MGVRGNMTGVLCGCTWGREGQVNECERQVQHDSIYYVMYGLKMITVHI